MSRTEKHIEAGIVRDLRALGCAVTKTSQHGKPLGMTEGLPDLYASHPRWQIRLWIEVKTARGRLRPAQADWHARERAAGGTVIVARSTADVIGAFRALGAPIGPVSARQRG